MRLSSTLLLVLGTLTMHRATATTERTTPTTTATTTTSMEVRVPTQEQHAGQQSHPHSATSAAAMFNDTAFLRDMKRNVHRAPSFDKKQEEAQKRRARLQGRRNKSRQTLLARLSETADQQAANEDATTTSTTASDSGSGSESNNQKKKGSTVHRLTQEEMQSVQRKTSWFGNSGAYAYNAALTYVADPTQDYDKWAQAYRMLGAFIDCDHDKSEGSQDGGGNGGGGNGACSRWMMWAAVRSFNLYGFCFCICHTLH